MRNNFERAIAQQLKRKRKVFTYESRRIPYVLHRNYVPDFTVRLRDVDIIIEGKGYLRPADKSKLVAVKACNPGIDVRILFDTERNYERNRKWCERHSFPCAWGTIPNEWLK